MSDEYIREAVAAYISGNVTSAEVQYENLDSIDLSTRSDPYIDVTLRFTGNEQVSLGEPPLIRQRGAVQFDVYVKQGTGTKGAYAITKELHTLFTRKSISGIEFAVPTTLNPLKVAGWHRLTVRAPFYMDN